MPNFKNPYYRGKIEPINRLFQPIKKPTISKQSLPVNKEKYFGGDFKTIVFFFFESLHECTVNTIWNFPSSIDGNSLHLEIFPPCTVFM